MTRYNDDYAKLTMAKAPVYVSQLKLKRKSSNANLGATISLLRAAYAFKTDSCYARKASEFWLSQHTYNIYTIKQLEKKAWQPRGTSFNYSAKPFEIYLEI